MTRKPIEDSIRAVTTILSIILVLIWLSIAILIWQVATCDNEERYWPPGLTPTPVVDTR